MMMVMVLLMLVMSAAERRTRRPAVYQLDSARVAELLLLLQSSLMDTDRLRRRLVEADDGIVIGLDAGRRQHATATRRIDEGRLRRSSAERADELLECRLVMLQTVVAGLCRHAVWIVEVVVVVDRLLQRLPRRRRRRRAELVDDEMVDWNGWQRRRRRVDEVDGTARVHHVTRLKTTYTHGIILSCFRMLSYNVVYRGFRISCTQYTLANNRYMDQQITHLRLQQWAFFLYSMCFNYK